MRLNLNLSQQGLVLVGVPIALMLTFLISLLLLFLKVEKEARENNHSKTIISTANFMVKQYYDAASQLIVYKHAKTDFARRKFELKLNETNESFAQLKKLLKEDPVELDMLVSLRAVADDGMSLMRRYERYIAGEEKLNGLEVVVLYKEFDLSGAKFTTELQKLIDHETAKHRVNYKEEARSRQLVKIWILLGVVSAIAIGTTLALIFTKNTTRRLAVLMNNTLLLSKKEALLPMVQGNDEISKLDLFFHQMALELERAARKERAIMDNAVDVICSIDPEGKFRAVNPASIAIWGYKPDELIGKHYSEIIDKEDLDKFAQGLEKMRQAESRNGAESQARQVLNLENKVISSSKNIVYVLWSIVWSDLELSYFCVAHDISDRKEIEKLKQEFVAMVSHELRTPLTSLQMTLALLLDGTYGDLSESAEQRIKGADVGVSRLILLINDLLDIEKMEAGKLSMNFADVSVGEILDRSLEAIQGYAEQQGVKIIAEEKNARIHADADRIVQVLVNLLSNAIKFSEDGAQVEIAVREKGLNFHFEVIDHGAGIPPGYEEIIFGKYEQAHIAKDKKRRGTGLGLPICKAIVEQHGGSIGVTSTAGGGSTFFFQIPKTAAAPE
ncbi:MAG: PAS domain-containing sensor histidine kinase [Candidatus Obscuribacterales bacterium]|nr:PAS domain-containing sensor histidine kinase [Candidatus Obscuribacterales bacterium]